jgi:hypothetical protein
MWFSCDKDFVIKALAALQAQHLSCSNMSSYVFHAGVRNLNDSEWLWIMKHEGQGAQGACSFEMFWGYLNDRWSSLSCKLLGDGDGRSFCPRRGPGFSNSNLRQSAKNGQIGREHCTTALKDWDGCTCSSLRCLNMLKTYSIWHKLGLREHKRTETSLNMNETSDLHQPFSPWQHLCPYSHC